MRLPIIQLRFAGSVGPGLSSDSALPFLLLPKAKFIWLLLLLTASLLLVGRPVSAMPPAGDDRELAAVALPQAYCENLIANPGFETQAGWVLSGVESPPQYTTDRAYRGNWSMRMGIVSTNNLASISAVQQTLDIPDFTKTLSLKLRYWPVSGSNPGNDLQYIDVYNGYNNQFIRRVWYDTADLAVRDMDADGDTDELDAQATEWLFLVGDLTDIKSVTNRIRIFFAVTNDGAGGATALYLDDVELLACDTQQPGGTPTVTPTATPTPTASGTPSTTPSSTPSVTATGTPGPTPTVTPTATQTPIPADTSTPTPVPPATPIPTGCVNVVLNGGFETSDHWIIGNDPYKPGYANEAGQIGARSMRLGTPPGGNVPSVMTYSSVRQLVTIPSTVQTATLTYLIKYRTEQAEDESPSNVSDRQEVILLNPDLSTLSLEKRVLRNRDNWQPERIELFDYIGRTFYLYFNVYNDGNGARTWAYLDDVALSVCYAQASQPTPTLTPTAPAQATATPTPLDELAVAQAESALATQAALMATEAAGTPTTVASRQEVGPDAITGSREVTPEGQVTPDLVPVSGTRAGVRFNNLSAFTVMLMVVGGFLVIALVILLVARAVSGRGGPGHP